MTAHGTVDLSTEREIVATRKVPMCFNNRDGQE